MPIDASIEQSYRDAFAVRGVDVTFERLVGDGNNVQPVSATVTAVVTSYTPDSAVLPREGFKTSGLGTLTQGDRKILVLEGDLRQKGFPVPLKKGDKAIVGEDRLTLMSVDTHTRALAGCYEIIASGV